MLFCETFGTSRGCELEDPEDGMSGFLTLNDLLERWPTGTYRLTVSDGTDTFTADLPFNFPNDPPVPDGTIAITSPTDGETDVSPTPTIRYEQTCANCSHVGVDLETLESPSSGFPSLQFETMSLESPKDLLLSDFEDDENGGMVAEVPNGTYFLDAFVTTETETEIAFNEDPTATFPFFAGGESVSPAITFTVPEPGSTAAGAAALAGLGLLASRRRVGRCRDRRRTH